MALEHGRYFLVSHLDQRFTERVRDNSSSDLSKAEGKNEF